MVGFNLRKAFTIEVSERDGQATSHLINHDIVPMPPSRRTWGWLEYTGFFFISQFCIGVWAGSAAMLGIGLAVWEVCVSGLIAGLLILSIGGATGWIGGEWHIGYTVLQRVIFGILGSYIGIIIRIMLSIISFASQAWLGGLCMSTILSSWSHSFLVMENTLPESAHMVTRDFVGFVVFQFISIPFLLIRPERIINLVKIANIITFFAMLGITIWATKKGGYGPLISQGSSYTTFSRPWAWFYSITSTLGAISAGLINQADFTRFTKKQGRQIPGLALCLYLPGVAVPLMGLLTASATVNIWGVAYWNPVEILLQWMIDDYSSKARAAAFFCGFGFVCSQLALNTVGNGFAAGMDMAGLFPKYINIRRGSLICAALSWVCHPWLYYNTSSVFIAVMASFSVFLAPLTGIMITDYFLLRKQKLELSALYTLSPEGSYYFWHGFNWRTIVAWITIFVPAMPGMIATVNPSIKVSQGALYYYYGNYVFGFLEAGALYYVVVRLFPPPGLGKQDTHDIYGTFTPEEAAKKGMVPFSPSTEVKASDGAESLADKGENAVETVAVSAGENMVVHA